MKTNSNIPIPKSARWKEGETVIYVNHIDNGYLPTGDPMTDKAGMRYEADFTIATSTDYAAQVAALTRMELDPVLDQQVIDNIEVNGGSAIKVVKDYKPTATTTDKVALSIAIANGAVKWAGKVFFKAGTIVTYDNKVWEVLKDLTANKTDLPPLRPDLYKKL